MNRLLIAAMVLATAAVPAAAQKPKYGVQVTAEKGVDFAKFRTYTWTRAQPSPDKTVDAQITAAVDRELAALGMTKAASGPGDVQVSYFSLSRTDVDVEGKKDAKGLLPQYWVGTLVVAMNEPASNLRVLRMRVDLPIDIQPNQLESAINHAAELMFAEYPTRKRK
jgi:hypothetical protein